MRFYFIFCLFIAAINPSLAQIFPVSLATQSIPPHTGNIADWTAPGSNRIAVNIILADANEVNFQARLKVKISGQGITLRSRNDLNLAPINLRYGAPTQLNGPDLAALLHYENLNFEGYTRQQYEANGGLPDGSYQICFEVFDYDRIDEEAASMESCVTVFASLHKTPVILAPIGLVSTNYPQFLPVQWQARHNGGFPTQYKVEIYEYDANSGMTPDLVVDFEQPFIFKEVMAMSSAIVDIADPQLIPGRDYIVRVQAEDVTQQNGFKNNGWSDFEIFTYGDSQCPAPFNIKSEQIDEASATISWDPIPGAANYDYVLKYRNKNKTNSQWYEDQTTGTSWKIDKLKENTTYEYQVYTICEGNTPGVLSPIDTFVTDTIPTFLDCGDENSLPLITNQTPIQNLEEDMILKVAGFDVYIDSIGFENETWSGRGKVHIAWINTYINVTIDAVSVNTDFEIFAGAVTAISDGLDALPGYISAADLAVERNAAPIDVCGGPNGVGTETENSTVVQVEEEQGYGGAEEEYVFVAGAGIGSANLPFGLTTLSTNNTYVIALDDMIFTPQGASLKSYMALDVPVGNGDKRHLTFTGNSNFHTGGLVGESKMFLESTVQAQLQSKTRFSFIGGNNSFVSWDCQGFQSVSLEGSVEFCRDMIIPIDGQTGEVDETGFVTGSFITTMPEWGDFTAAVSVTPFAVTQRPDWKWEATNMIFDYSDATTPEVIIFPEDYQHADILDASQAAENYPAWTGFFIETATVTLPNSLTGVEVGDEVTIGGENIMLDATGFSAWIYGTELLPLEKGRMGTWAFSIDSLGVSIQSSHFENMAFAGEIDVPAFEKEFDYSAFIDPGDEYFFSVAWNDTLKLEAFKAEMELHASSAIAIEYKKSEQKYYAEAVLHGKASFQPQTEAGTGLEIPHLAFQDFKLTTSDPYVELGDWQLEGDVSANFGAFDLTLCGFGITRDQVTDEVIIGFCSKVHLTGASGGELAADGFFRIIADVKYSDVLDQQIWAYKEFKVDTLSLDASGTGYAFKGSIEFFEDHPEYGNGFRGAVEAVFQPRLTVGAVAQFGSVGDYKYFFADALATYNPGITLGTSGLMLYGFGGGASYHMSRTGFESIVMPQEGNNPVPPTGVGVSLSGMRYTPNRDVGVGIKATVAIGTVNRTLFNGIATLEFIFNNSGGLSQIGFDGRGKFLTQPNADPQLSCNLNMTYDFPAEAFHASLDIFVNIRNQITGAYDNNYAGNGTLHVDPKDWYIYIGTPDAPMSFALNTEFIPKLDPLDISMGGYFDAGTLIPPFPGLPSAVTDILGDFNVVSRDDPRFAGGNGLMFGANIQAKLEGLDYGIFYAGFNAGAGWDMMLYDFGANARCAGNELAPDPIGIDGWYGTGQMYAYIQGEVGIRVDLFVFKGNIKILDIGAAAALQARLPNPMYMKGKVGGYFRVLNGLVSGNCSFKFEAGELCEVVGQDVLGVDIISDTSPNLNDNQEVDVFIRPEVTFNFSMGETFSMYDEEGELQLYRAGLLEFKLINMDDGTEVPGTIVWSPDQAVLGFKTPDILAPQTNFKMTVKVNVENKTPYTKWSVLHDTFGDPYFQEKEITFKTGDAPNFIPMDNVAFSYPIYSQFNYLKSESPEGYVQLVQGQDYLFDGSNGGEWINKIRLIQNGTILKQYDFNYNSSENKLTYQIPEEGLANSTITQLVMVAIPTSSEAAIDANVVMVETEFVYNQGSVNTSAGDEEDFSSILLKQRSLENQAQNLNEEIMMALNFRTSRYNSLAQKMEGMSAEEFATSTLVSGTVSADGTETGLFMDGFGLDWNGPEMFDKFELQGYYNSEGDFIPPLIVLEADLSTTGKKNNREWYEEETYVNMSQHLPSAAFPITWRPAENYGAIPTRAFYLEQRPGFDNKILTDQEMQNNAATFNSPRARMQFKVPFYMALDHAQLKQDVAIRYQGLEMPKHLKDFMIWKFKTPYVGNYKYTIGYKKPGRNIENRLEKEIRFRL